ncbi:hypothetical protein VZT92_011136 [Zoarces viviparus]|uniref:Uncharacterized protein n=1 Tax=Zoarces viviparus TaxID=48416 RepID=A0AAW1FB48_ZOAVI
MNTRRQEECPHLNHRYSFCCCGTIPGTRNKLWRLVRDLLSSGASRVVDPVITEPRGQGKVTSLQPR